MTKSKARLLPRICVTIFPQAVDMIPLFAKQLRACLDFLSPEEKVKLQEMWVYHSPQLNPISLRPLQDLVADFEITMTNKSWEFLDRQECFLGHEDDVLRYALHETNAAQKPLIFLGVHFYFAANLLRICLESVERNNILFRPDIWLAPDVSRSPTSLFQIVGRGRTETVVLGRKTSQVERDDDKYLVQVWGFRPLVLSANQIGWNQRMTFPFYYYRAISPFHLLNPIEESLIFSRWLERPWYETYRVDYYPDDYSILPREGYEPIVSSLKWLERVREKWEDRRSNWEYWRGATQA